MMNSSFLKTIAGAALLLSTMSAFAAAPGAIELLQSAIGTALDKIFTDLQSLTVLWLGFFMLLQFTWTNVHLLLNGADLEKVWAKLLGSLFWFGICVYIFHNGPPFIKNMATYIMDKATGATGAVFDPTSPIDLGINVASTLLTVLDGSQSVLGALNPFPSIMMGLVSIVILAVSALLAFKIFMIFIETKMVIALSPFSFALLGLNAFKDQGLAPLKYLVSMALRMFLLGAVLSAMTVFSDTIVGSFKSLPPASDPSVWPPIWAASIGYVLLGALTLRVDSIAAMLASGSSQMSTGDSAAVGAIAGAAAGAAMAAATGGASLAATAMKVPQSMGDFMKGLGGAGSVSNAMANGAGGLGATQMGPSPTRALSVSNGPAHETMKNGAPIRPEGSPGASSTPASTASSTPEVASSHSSEPVSGSSSPAPVQPASVDAGSSANAGINGVSSPASTGATMDDVLKAIGQQNKPQSKDRMADLKNHVLSDAPAVTISMNTHQD